MTSDSSQQGLLLPPREASLCKVFHAIDRREGARFPRLPAFAGKASRETRGESAGKVLESSAHRGQRQRRLLTWATRNKKRSRGGTAGDPKRVSPPEP